MATSIPSWCKAALAAALAMLAAIVWGAANPPPLDEFTLRHFDAAWVAQARLFRWRSIVAYALAQVAQLTLLVFLAYSLPGQRLLRQQGPGTVWPVLRAAAFVLAATALVRFPFSFYRGFLLEHRAGLSNQTFPAWLADWVMGWGINAVITLAALALLVPLIRSMPRLWWVPAGVVLAVGLVAITALSPVLIDPLYYQFEVLDDEELRTELERMAAELGLDVDEILVANASRRTLRTNAYFTGVGTTQRIVLYDTLLNRFPRDQVLAVVAHELGHWYHRHIWKGVALGSIAILLGLWALQKILRAEAARQGWPPLDPRLVAHVFLAIMLAGLLLMPVRNGISRHWERQADAISYQLSPKPQATMALYRNLGITNLADPQPNPVLVLLTFSHPPAIQRIQAVYIYLPK